MRVEEKEKSNYTYVVWASSCALPGFRDFSASSAIGISDIIVDRPAIRFFGKHDSENASSKLQHELPGLPIS